MRPSIKKLIVTMFTTDYTFSAPLLTEDFDDDEDSDWNEEEWWWELRDLMK